MKCPTCAATSKMRHALIGENDGFRAEKDCPDCLGKGEIPGPNPLLQLEADDQNARILKAAMSPLPPSSGAGKDFEFAWKIAMRIRDASAIEENALMIQDMCKQKEEEIKQLRAALDLAKGALEKAKADVFKVRGSPNAVTIALAALDLAKEKAGAIAEYAEHGRNCKSHNGTCYPDYEKCDCGLNEALAAIGRVS